MMQDVLDNLVDEYAGTVDEYINHLIEAMKQPSFNSDDMRKLASIATELAEYAEENASEFDEVVDEYNRRRYA